MSGLCTLAEWARGAGVALMALVGMDLAKALAVTLAYMMYSRCEGMSYKGEDRREKRDKASELSERAG